MIPPPEAANPKTSGDEEEVLVDLLFASSGIEPEAVHAAERLTILPGFDVPVATTGHLLALKVLSEQENRPQDLMDALALIQAADLRDLQDAREAVELIIRRGFAICRSLNPIGKKPKGMVGAGVKVARRPYGGCEQTRDDRRPRSRGDGWTFTGPDAQARTPDP